MSLSALAGAVTLIALGGISLTLGSTSAAVTGVLVTASIITAALLAPQLHSVAKTHAHA